jgi:glycine betaine catabolism A
LTPVAVDTWEGFIFIDTDPTPKETLQDYLGEVGRSFAGYPFAEIATGGSFWEIDVNANWKVCKDVFQEVYHIFSLHNRSTGAAFAGKSNPYLNVHELAIFGTHARISVPASLDWKPTPVEALAKRHGMLTLQKQGSSSRGMPAGVNPTGAPDWSFSGFICFPNTCLYVADGGFLTHTFWPLSKNRTHWEPGFIFPRRKRLRSSSARNTAGPPSLTACWWKTEGFLRKPNLYWRPAQRKKSSWEMKNCSSVTITK